jgi:hypothetical protein
MFVAFMPLNILLCDAVLPYIVLCVEIFRSLNLNFNHRGFNLYEVEVKGNPLTQQTRSGLRDKPKTSRDKVFALPELNLVNPA